MTMDRDEPYGEYEQQSAGPMGATMAIVLVAVVVIVLLLLGAGVAFFFMARSAREEALVAEEIAFEEARMEALMREKALIEAPMKAEVEKPQAALGTPVAREQLVGARLDHAAPTPEIQWNFAAERFTLKVRGFQAPPFPMDKLLGKGNSDGQVDGRWRLSRDGKSLEVMDATSDGRPGSVSATLRLFSMKNGRVNLGGSEYWLKPGAAKDP
jgi:hypothetical protein